MHPDLIHELERLGWQPGEPLDAAAAERLVGLLDARQTELSREQAAHARTAGQLAEQRDVSRAAAHAERARAQFLANMSHELRTPMNAIIGYSELVAEELAERRGDDDLLADVRRVHRSGQHLLQLINDILDLSRIDAGRLELERDHVDPAALVHGVVATARKAAEVRGNHITVRVPNGPRTFVSDRKRIRQCLQHLLSNAIKFTDHGAIEVRVRQDGRRTTFEVRDQGIGIATDHLEAMFAPFVQADAGAKRRAGGTGLGLTLTRRFVELLGGSITAVSEPGEGSTFRLELPDLAIAPERGAQLVAEAQQAVPGDRIVLHVDDDPDTVDLTRRILGAEGFQVVAALDGHQALELAQRLRPVAILLDVVLPGLTGWEVLTRLKSDPAVADVPVIMVTTVDDRTRGLALGAADYLVKPIDRRGLVDRLRRLPTRDVSGDVLVVDDDDATRRLLRRYLQRAGWQVRTASDGREGLEAVRDQPPAVVLLDLVMPELDGFRFLEQLRSRPEHAELPVLVTTAKDIGDDDEARLRALGTRAVSKHAHSMDQILVEVSRILGVRADE